MFDQSANRFRLEVDWVKALPGGVETDFVLVSCAGMPRPGEAPGPRRGRRSHRAAGAVV